MNKANLAPLTEMKLRELAPSVFATEAAERTSDRYKFIPTTQVLEALSGHGWHPVTATQSRCKTPDGKLYCKHMIRLRTAMLDIQVGEFVPELVLTNSHNGLASYKLMAGIFRLVCSNGMIVQEASFGSISIRHKGYTDQQVIDVSAKVIDSVPLLAQSVKRFQAVELQDMERLQFARSALQLVYGEKAAPFEASKLLNIRRDADRSNTLWHVLNRVQENVMRGGISYKISGSRKESNSTRAVKSVDKNVRLNRQLWELADRTATAKEGVVLSA